ncbi:hypothetical protein GCM10018777_31520 [Streptomyces albogriseolus]|uniref:hypothetical protein n=1 Tax=Streptomyces TaxID=1883 RepID=UPI0016794994|nr:hypothetical protein [Streptomyces viridodiastaticus]GHG15468.1 hypothetical protein GCM10018777_31520 [Streptomyces viridodiastaticus]
MSSELWVAVIAAGSAVAGAVAGGWFARSAGLHQAAATRDTVQATLDEQRQARTEERRRRVYSNFLALAHDMSSNWGDASAYASLQKAAAEVTIEGPNPVVRSCYEYLRCVREWAEDPARTDALSIAHAEFIVVVRQELGTDGGTVPDLP